MKPYYQLLLCIMCFVFCRVNAQNTLKTNIYFESGKAVLSPEAEQALKKLADSLQTFQTYKIILKGHTDNTGDSSENQRLSEQRVASTLAYLTEMGIKKDAFSSNAYGKIKPVADNLTEEGKQKNRRVEIIVSFTRVPVIIPEKASILELYRKFNQDVQNFIIRTDRDTTLRCKNGTIMNVAEGTFGGKAKEVTLTVIEYYKKSDMLLGNLNTMSNGSVLETQGMLYTEAVDENGKNVNIQRGKTINIMIPVDTIRNDMKLFRGNWGHDSMMNWTTSARSNFLRLPAGILNDYNKWAEGTGGGTTECRLFFCKIRALFRGERVGGSRGRNGEFMYGSAALDSLFRLYNVKSMKKLLDTLRRERMNNVEKDIAGGTSKLSDVSYYVFNTSNLGWINCDAFSKYPASNMIDMKVNLRTEKNVDCKLVFSRIGSILQGAAVGGIYQFSRIPKGIRAWVVALKYDEGKAYLFMKELRTGNETVDVNFEESSLAEIREKMKVLDKLGVR